MGDLVPRVSLPVLSDEELLAKLTADGLPPEQIEARLADRQVAIAKAQGRYDQAPPRFYRPVADE